MHSNQPLLAPLPEVQLLNNLHECRWAFSQACPARLDLLCPPQSLYTAISTLPCSQGWACLHVTIGTVSGK